MSQFYARHGDKCLYTAEQLRQLKDLRRVARATGHSKRSTMADFLARRAERGD